MEPKTTYTIQNTKYNTYTRQFREHVHVHVCCTCVRVNKRETEWESENKSTDRETTTTGTVKYTQVNEWANKSVKCVEKKSEIEWTNTPKNDNDFKFSLYWRIYVLASRHFYFLLWTLHIVCVLFIIHSTTHHHKFWETTREREHTHNFLMTQGKRKVYIYFFHLD